MNEILSLSSRLHRHIFRPPRSTPPGNRLHRPIRNEPIPNWVYDSYALKRETPEAQSGLPELSLATAREGLGADHRDSIN